MAVVGTVRAAGGVRERGRSRPRDEHRRLERACGRAGGLGRGRGNGLGEWVGIADDGGLRLRDRRRWRDSRGLDSAFDQSLLDCEEGFRRRPHGRVLVLVGCCEGGGCGAD